MKLTTRGFTTLLACGALGATVLSGSVRAGTADYNFPDEVSLKLDADATTKLMETRAGADAVASWLAGAPFRLAGEDRTRAVRRNIVPAHWLAAGAPKPLFLGVAEPGEHYVFQCCVASAKARTLDWSAGPAARRVTPARCAVAANGVKPLWVLVPVPKDAGGRTLTGQIAVTDAASGEKATLDYALKVKTGAPLANGGTRDAARLARLGWLESDAGRSDTKVTRPYLPIAVNVRTRTLKILGRELTLGADGLPAGYRTFFDASNTRITPTATELFAAPVAFAGPAGAGTAEGFRFTEKTPCRVRWEATRRHADGARLEVKGRLEYDGFAQFTVRLVNGAKALACNPTLAFTLPAARAQLQMGLDRRGGAWPETDYAWTWQEGLHQDATWFGSTQAGLMLRLKDTDYRRPLINCYHKWKPLVLPDCWKRGGVTFAKDADTARVVATAGTRTFAAGEDETYVFDLYLTPFKPTDLRESMADRYDHLGQRTAKMDIAKMRASGDTVVNLHHNTVWNPYINYPYNDDGGPLLKKQIADCHRAGLRVKLYYTTREISQNMPEFFALASLDGEVLFKRPESVPGWPLTNPKGPHPWLTEHVGADILPAWRETIRFPGAYPDRLDLAVITNPDSQRWNNFYLAGLDHLVKDYAIDGLYIDDTALDRDSMQRARRILDQNGNKRRRIDMHSWSHFNSFAGRVPSDIAFMELYPYFDRLWHGEGFNPNEGSPEFWLVERSGFAWGVYGQQLLKGNPWRGMLFGETARKGWGGKPEGLWKLMDGTCLPNATYWGFWDPDRPVRIDGAPGCRASVFSTPKAVVVAVAGFGKSIEKARLVVDFKKLGLHEDSRTARLAEIKDVQAGAPVDLARPLEIPVNGGAILVFDRKPRAFTGVNPTVGHLQRTFKALEESTAAKPADLRVLFFGQSIVAQGWGSLIMDDWRRRYPTARITCENKAIGGFTSPSLSRTAPSLLYPTYPDVLFFHVYGPLDKYEEIIRETRARTTAEIVLWSSHLRANDDPQKMSAGPDERTRGIADIAKRYGCTYVDLNRKWARFLAESRLPASAMLRDTVHLLKDAGALKLYADFLSEELVRIPGTEADGWSGTVTTFGADDPRVKRRTDGALEFSFDGNRVVGLASAPFEADVLLDGHPVAEDRGEWYNTLASATPMWMPAILRVSFKSAPVAEKWTMTHLASSDPIGQPLRFRLSGSVSGDMGTGDSSADYCSPNGRVFIEKRDFGVGQYKFFGKKVQPGKTVTWETKPQFTFPCRAAKSGDRLVLVQGSANGPHVLTIRPKAGSKPAFASFTVHKPADPARFAQAAGAYGRGSDGTPSQKAMRDYNPKAAK